MHWAPQELRTYFVTCSTANRLRVFQVHAQASLFVEGVQYYRVQGRFALHSYVVMPDHVHLLITPAPDVSLEKAIQYVRGGFSFRLKSKFPVWERGHFGKRVPDRAAYEACVRYIHLNPVVAGLVSAESEYGFSSAGRTDLDPMPEWFVRQSRG